MKKNGGLSKGEVELVLRNMGLRDEKEGRVSVKIQGGGKEQENAMNRKIRSHLECLGANEKMVWVI